MIDLSRARPDHGQPDSSGEPTGKSIFPTFSVDVPLPRGTAEPATFTSQAEALKHALAVAGKPRRGFRSGTYILRGNVRVKKRK